MNDSGNIPSQPIDLPTRPASPQSPGRALVSDLPPLGAKAENSPLQPDEKRVARFVASMDALPGPQELRAMAAKVGAKDPAARERVVHAVLGRLSPTYHIDMVVDTVVRYPASRTPVILLLEQLGAPKERVVDLAEQVQRELVKATTPDKELRHELLYNGYLKLTHFQKGAWTADDCKYAVKFDPNQLKDIQRDRPDLFDDALKFVPIKRRPDEHKDSGFRRVAP